MNCAWSFAACLWLADAWWRRHAKNLAFSHQDTSFERHNKAFPKLRLSDPTLHVASLRFEKATHHVPKLHPGNGAVVWQPGDSTLRTRVIKSPAQHTSINRTWGRSPNKENLRREQKYFALHSAYHIVILHAAFSVHSFMSHLQGSSTIE